MHIFIHVYIQLSIIIDQNQNGSTIRTESADVIREVMQPGSIALECVTLQCVITVIIVEQTMSTGYLQNTCYLQNRTHDIYRTHVICRTEHMLSTEQYTCYLDRTVHMLSTEQYTCYLQNRTHVICRTEHMMSRGNTTSPKVFFPVQNGTFKLGRCHHASIQ